MVVLLYMVINIYHQVNIPQMLAYIPAPWILWVLLCFFCVIRRMEAILSTISGQGSSDDTWPFHSWHSSERCRVAQPALLNTRDTDWWLSHWATPLKHSFHWGSSSHIGLKIKHVSNHPRNIMEHHGILVSIFGMHNSWVSPNRRF